MLASVPASMVNQKPTDLGIPNRFKLNSSRFRLHPRSVCSKGATMKREVIRVEPMSSWLAKRNTPVSPVTRGGGMVFVSGLPPFDPDTGELFTGPIERQAELVLEQMKR